VKSIKIENEANPGTYFETDVFHQQITNFTEDELNAFKESIFFIEIGGGSETAPEQILSDGLLSVLDPGDNDATNDTNANFVNPVDLTLTNFSAHVEEANFEWWFAPEQITHINLPDGHSYISYSNKVVGYEFNNPSDNTPINVLGYEIMLSRVTSDASNPLSESKKIFIPFGDQDLGAINWSDHSDGAATIGSTTPAITDADLGQASDTDFSTIYYYTYVVYADAYHTHPKDITPDYIVSGTDGADLINVAYTGDTDGDLVDNGDGNPDAPGQGDGDFILAGSGDDVVQSALGNDTVYGEGGSDTISGGEGNDLIIGGAGSDVMTGGDGDDTFVFDNDGADVITDFGTGNTGPIIDGVHTNNDYVDLSAYYTDQDELHADFSDDGILNQSTGDFADNTAMAAGASLEIQGIDASDLRFETTNVPCFTAGTLIKAIDGQKSVGDLRQGDLVWTKDAGLQPISWISHKTFKCEALRHNENVQPIRIAAGAMGAGLPKRDLIVSQQHRLLVNSKIVERMTSETEVLVSAKHLLRIRGIDLLKHMDEVTYIHFMFDRHHIVEAEGLLTESLYTGPEALKSLSPEAREEIFAIFPGLMEANYAAPKPARMLLSGRKARKLAQRQIQNKKPLQQQVIH